jgi:hypothetical protein
MPFDVAGALKKTKDALADFGAEKTRDALSEVNVLLKLLQDAGYEVGQLEVELGVPPKITIGLKTQREVSEEKLDAILRDNQDKSVLAAILGSLIQANKLRDAVKVETLELKDVQIVLTTSPNITLQWKEKSASA